MRCDVILKIILDALAHQEIRQYRICQTREETLECFFIRRGLDLTRSLDTNEYEVTVYRPFVKDGAGMLGSSSVRIHPDETAEEIEEALAGAYQAAALVCNPAYELAQPEDAPEDGGPVPDVPLDALMRHMTDALYAEDRLEDVWINSAEFFVSRIHRRICNSNGVDVRYEKLDIRGEYVTQCTSPQDVELYHSFLYYDDDAQALRAEAANALAITRERARAFRAPRTGSYRVILSEQQMRTLLNYYVSRSSASMIYQKYSGYALGANVQGGDLRGDALTIRLVPTEPYSPEGVPMRERLLLDRGVLTAIHGGCRFTSYLGLPPTGDYTRISVPTGETPLSEMQSEPYLHIVSFSDFQMDDFSGYFSGEIRLAFLFDGQTTTPVTGGSVSGSILEAQKHLIFSKERYRSGDYDGPLAVCIDNVRVAGI